MNKTLFGMMMVWVIVCGVGLAAEKPKPSARTDVFDMLNKQVVLTNVMVMEPDPDAATNAPKTEVEILQAENETLKAKIEELRAEIKNLRDMIENFNLQRGARASDAAPRRVTTPTSTESTSPVGNYWMTSDQKRHNRGCKYFKKKPGKSCELDDGTPCSICGG